MSSHDSSELLGMGPRVRANRDDQAHRAGPAMTTARDEAGEVKPRRRPRLNGLIPILSVSALLAITVCSAGVLISRNETQRREAQVTRIENRHTLAAEFVAAYIAGVIEREGRLAAAVLSGPVTSAEFERISLENGYAAAVLLDADGSTLAVTSATLALLGLPQPTRYPHLQRALEGDTAVSNVLMSSRSPEVILAFAVPFRTIEGRRVFSVGHRPTHTPLVAFTSNTLAFETARALLIDGNGTVITSSDPDVQPGENLDQWPELAAATATTGYHEVAGEETYTVTGRVAGTSWHLVFTVETGELWATVSGPARLLPWGILLAFTVAALAALTMWRRAHREHQARLGYQQQLHRLAMSDPLTGLANRRVAVDRLQMALRRAHRSGMSVAVVFIDIDEFKMINDSHGHAAGDAVLIAVADRLRAVFRRQDTISRIGGDEFVVICEDLADLDALNDLEVRTQVALAEPYVVGPSLVSGSASVGVTTAAADETPEAVLARADRQMYEAKVRRDASKFAHRSD